MLGWIKMKTACCRKFSSGFAVLPILVMVALVGIMVPTVKLVTSNESFDLRSLANPNDLGEMLKHQAAQRNKQSASSQRWSGLAEQFSQSDQPVSEPDPEPEEEEHYEPPPVAQPVSNPQTNNPSNLNAVVQQESDRLRDLADQQTVAQIDQAEEEDTAADQSFIDNMAAVVGELPKKETAAEITARLQADFDKKKAEQEEASKTEEEIKQDELANSGYLLEEDIA